MKVFRNNKCETYTSSNYIMIYLQCFIDNHNTRKFILYTFPPLNTHFNACFRIAKQKGKFISQLFRCIAFNNNSIIVINNKAITTTNIKAIQARPTEDASRRIRGTPSE